MKVCIKCNKLKPLSEFHNCKANKDGKKGSCKKCTNAYNKNYKSNNIEKIKRINKNYKYINRNSIADKKKQWDNKNKTHTRKYRINNKSTYAKNNRNWIINNRERRRELSRKMHAKRKRNLGFIPLNKKFDEADGHHIDKQHVVYIPKELHMSIPHKQTDLESMETINELTLNWMLGVKNC